MRKTRRIKGLLLFRLWIMIPFYDLGTTVILAWGFGSTPDREGRFNSYGMHH